MSTSASPRLLFDIGSGPVRPLPSRFSIKNDDALDEVGVWFSVSFPCMFSRFHGAFTRQNRAVPVLIVRYGKRKSKRSFQASLLLSCGRMRSHRRDGTGISSVPAGGEGARETEAVVQ